jgi:hypothetical protein
MWSAVEDKVCTSKQPFMASYVQLGKNLHFMTMAEKLGGKFRGCPRRWRFRKGWFDQVEGRRKTVAECGHVVQQPLA